MNYTSLFRRSPKEKDELKDGILLIDKNSGETSYDVVRKLKRILGIRKVGHSGTLDPFATGLLIILLGQGTKLSPYLMAGKKRYLATLRLGIETDTLDPSGRVIRTVPVPKLEKEEIIENLKKFVGDIEQTPPLYSAINYRGKRAYYYARKGIDIELKKRSVSVSSIDNISVNLPEITMDICCSGGTYIRSLAADIGEQMGTAAHLVSLRRLSSGSFKVEEALNSGQIDEINSINFPSGRIISLKDAAADIEEYDIGPELADRVRNGYRPEWKEISGRDPLSDMSATAIKLVTGRTLVAVIEINPPGHDDRKWIKKIRIFH